MVCGVWCIITILVLSLHLPCWDFVAVMDDLQLNHAQEYIYSEQRVHLLVDLTVAAVNAALVHTYMAMHAH